MWIKRAADVSELVLSHTNANATTATVGLVMILHELIESIPKLSAKTTTALRAQFPRPRLVGQLKKAIGNVEGDPMLIYQREIMKIDAGEQSPAAPSGLWKHGALEMVESLTALLGGSGQCARRGCAKPATGPPCHVERCEGTRYCSTACMEGYVCPRRNPNNCLTFIRDWGQHWEICCDGDYKRIIERNNAIFEMNRYGTMHFGLARLLISSSQKSAYA